MRGFGDYVWKRYYQESNRAHSLYLARKITRREMMRKIEAARQYAVAIQTTRG